MRKIIFFFCLITLPAMGQGWQNITPPGMQFITRFKALDLNEGYEITVWNFSKGWTTRNLGIWDTLQVYWTYWCGIGEQEEYFLIDYDRFQSDPNRLISCFMQTGCIVEARGYVYLDTAGRISRSHQVKQFDDISGASHFMQVILSRQNPNEVYLTFLDSLYFSNNGGNSFIGLSSPDTIYFSPRINRLYLHPLYPSWLWASGYTAPYYGPYSLFISSNGGLDWFAQLSVPPIHQFVADPVNSDNLFWASDSGVYESTYPCIPFYRALEGSFRSIAYSDSGIYAGNNRGELYRRNAMQIWELYNNTFSDLPIIGLYPVSGGDTVIACTPGGVYKVYDRFVLDVAGGFRPVGSFQLFQNYPNPFNPATTIRFFLTEKAVVQLTVYDVLGRTVRTLCNGLHSAGEHAIHWDGRDAQGKAVAAGMYFYCLSSGTKNVTKKMLLIR